MKNNGNSLIWLIPVIAVLIVIILFGIQFVSNLIYEGKWENIKTDMLKIQAKAKLIFENYHLNNANGLLGEKIEDITTIQNFGVSDGENYYKWTKDTMSNTGLSESTLKDEEYYLINYDTEEVIYSAGFKTKEDEVFYKLSDIKNLNIK